MAKFNKLKGKVFELLDKGKTQKEVAQIVGVSEKTLGKWAKEKPKTQTQMLEQRFYELSKLPHSSVKELLELRKAIKELKELSMLLQKMY